MATKRFQEIIRNNKNRNHVATLKAMIDLAEYFSEHSSFKEALAGYEEAKRYLSEKLPASHPKKTGLEYEIDRGLFIMVEKEQMPEKLDQFIRKYQNADMDIILKQNFPYAVANILIKLEKYDQAHEYVTKSMKILEQFPKKDTDDYHVRKAQLYAYFTEIAVYQKDKDETAKYLDLAFLCPKYEKDPNLHFFLLCTQRKHTSRENRMELTKKMFTIFERFKSGKLKIEKIDAFYNFYEDYLFVNDTIKAEEMLWRIYSDKECLKLDKKGFVIKNLITLYKLPKRLEQIERFKEAGDYGKAVLVYKKIADEFFVTEEFENARDYYLKMKEAAMNIPEEPGYGNLQKVKDALEFLIFCLREYSVCEKDSNELLQYLEEMHSLQQKLGATENVLIEIEVEQAFIKSICDNFTFEERKLDLLNVKEKLTTDVQRFNFYKCVIRLIKYNQEEFGDGVQDIWVLEEQLNIFKEKIKDFKEPPTIITNIPFEDECDAISDDQILQALEEKWMYFDKIQSFKKKLEKIDVYGETELYKEISPNVELGHIKFLIDECGYDEILEKPDNAGITPLMKAIMIDRTDIIEYLLEKGANANPAMSKNEDPLIGATPLMEAVRQRNCDAIRLLLQHKANPIAKNKLGETAIDLMNDQLKFGRTYLSNIISGPKRAKKESPMTQEKYDELKEAKKFLMEAEKEYIENYGEYLQNVDENVNENPTFNGMGKRRRESNNEKLN